MDRAVGKRMNGVVFGQDAYTDLDLTYTQQAYYTKCTITRGGRGKRGKKGRRIREEKRGKEKGRGRRIGLSLYNWGVRIRQ